MDNIKNRMYNFEETPPKGVWEAIAAELDRDEAKAIPTVKKKNNTFYYIAAAASVAILLFCVIFFTNRSSKPANKEFIITSSGKTQSDTAETKNNNVIITVPEEQKTISKNNNTKADQEIAQDKFQKGGPNRNKNSEEKKPEDSTGNDLIASNSTPQYITIEGPQGQPVKVSSKMTALIDSSNEKIPPKPIWNKKINEWREIMKGSTLAPTPGNFLDIIELTKSVKDHK